MRITFVLPTVNMSGGIKVVALYANLLKQMGHKVVLVSPPAPGEKLVRRIKNWIRGRKSPDVQQVSHLDGMDLDHRVLDRYRKPSEADLPDADILVATWWETAEWIHGLPAGKGARVYFVQGHEVFDFLPVERSKATYRLPFHKIVVSEWLKSIMADEYGDFQVDLVPNSIDPQQFFAPKRSKNKKTAVGFLYSPSSVKGVDVVIDTLQTLIKTYSDLKIVAFGSTPPSDDLGLGENFTFYCSPEQSEIRNIYASCDVWVSASRSEGFNLTVMEAMACHTPVIATRTGWPEKAVVDGRNGFLIEIDDSAALKARISQVVQMDNRQWEQMSLEARQTVGDSSWESSALLFEQALNRACDRARRQEIEGGC
jgi:glycosyltransferase involved in cell wall biosynthesis